MNSHLRTAAATGALLALLVAAPAGAGGPRFTPGAPGVGDDYYPTYGNGGYDVGHYDLDVTYVPDTDVLAGHATITARATQNLSRFNLDLVGLTVDAVRVDGRAAGWSRSGDELTVRPRKGLRDGHRFTVDVRYHGVPETFTIPGTTFEAGFMHTDDGAMIAGQPEVSAACTRSTTTRAIGRRTPSRSPSRPAWRSSPTACSAASAPAAAGRPGAGRPGRR
jgi:hypothetical protein